MNPLIIQNKYSELKAGYPVYINVDSVRAFTAKVGADIKFGALLVRTTDTKVYESVENKSAAVIDANEIVGINMATNVKLSTAYPGTAAVTGIKGGEQGDNAQNGEIAVPFVGTAPLENSPVYLITVAGTDPGQDKGLVTSVSTSNAALGTKLELPQFRFTGLTDTTTGLTVLKKLY
jgi:hypothetical protein